MRKLTQPSILRNLLLAFLGLGLAMGLLFPLYAQFFVEWRPGMYAMFYFGCIIAGLAVGALNYLLLRLILLRKLERLSGVCTAIGNNDLTHTCEIESHDLIGELAGSFNRMAESLRGMIGLIHESTDRLSTSADALVNIVGEATRRQGDQRDTTALVATAMNEMAATVREVAVNTQQAADAASEAAGEAQKGALTATEALGSIGNLNTGIQKATSVIDKVREENDNIRSVLDVIQGISEQTNLLALNAAIEAARAGEQGRGFAVVADEVRNLARRTQDSAGEIQDMLARLNTQVGAAVEAMGEASEQASQSETHVEETAMSLGEISGAIKSIEQMNIQIASAVEQQSTVAEDINRNVNSINDAAEVGAESLVRAQESTGEVSEVATDLREVVRRFTL
ncbi:methyl-accepting chemotaxis protein [Thioalkalivibrio denitrificans]|uniref:Methyl-accepting chemotaxis protein n=1 Tax=Thioalkalivibrio denitrificans TaxID=108003 RepID=A0A1V3NCG9_9GAMM|nr:HAMP domain-containing methyl-accepting chemotaxis protein [Thioalkalivibrio denitrificans]OOG22735.1 methyl-accepting chemotaxis protein [Thioalkalivibrio denitrificans]